MNEYPCPVCDKFVSESEWHDGIFGGHYLVETDAKCNEGHWSQSMSYGLYAETVGDREWGWTHRETESDREAREADIKQAIKEYREAHL